MNTIYLPLAVGVAAPPISAKAVVADPVNTPEPATPLKDDTSFPLVAVTQLLEPLEPSR